jgi:hypothetical protein
MNDFFAIGPVGAISVDVELPIVGIRLEGDTIFASNTLLKENKGLLKSLVEYGLLSQLLSVGC